MGRERVCVVFGAEGGSNLAPKTEAVVIFQECYARVRECMEFHRPPEVTASPEIAVLAAIGLFLLFFCIWAILKKRRASNVVSLQKCRWKKNKEARVRLGFVAWRCKTCGVEAFSSDGRPPKECKKSLRQSGL